MENGFEKVYASAITGTAMTVFYPLANFMGWITWGAISDKLGRKRSLIITMIIQGVVITISPIIAGRPALLYLSAALIGFNFGGNFVLSPTITADAFGNKYVGRKYGWIFLAYLISGIFGPFLGVILGDMDNFTIAFIICGTLFMSAALLITMVTPPNKKIK